MMIFVRLRTYCTQYVCMYDNMVSLPSSPFLFLPPLFLNLHMRADQPSADQSVGIQAVDYAYDIMLL